MEDKLLTINYTALKKYCDEAIEMDSPLGRSIESIIKKFVVGKK